MLVHFCVLHYSSGVFPSYIFASLVNATHILGLAHVVPFAFDHFVFN
jgi:hypothetical protein